MFCQPADLEDLGELGLDLRAVPDGAAIEWEGLSISRTGGRHGREDGLIQALAPVSGFAVAAPGEPTVYVAGDTVWCPEVAAAIEAHDPRWIVVNAGGARFLEGGTITMEAGDVLAVAEALRPPAWWRCTWRRSTTAWRPREELRGAIDAAGLAGRVAVPDDGETVSP